jgi:hypothetical protein
VLAEPATKLLKRRIVRHRPRELTSSIGVGSVLARALHTKPRPVFCSAGDREMQRTLQRPLTAKEFIIESLFSRPGVRLGSMADDEEPTLLQASSSMASSPPRSSGYGSAVHVTHLPTPPPLSILSPPTMVDSSAALCKRQRREALLELLGQTAQATPGSTSRALFAGAPVAIRVKSSTPPTAEAKKPERGQRAPAKAEELPRTPPPIVTRPERTKKVSTLVWSIAFVTFGLSVGLGAGLVVTGRAQPLLTRAKGYVQAPASPAPPAAVVGAGPQEATPGAGTAAPTLPPTIAAALTPTNRPGAPPAATNAAAPVPIPVQPQFAAPDSKVSSSDAKAAPTSSGHHHRHATATGPSASGPGAKDDQDPLDDPTPPPPPKVTAPKVPERVPAPPDTVAAKPPAPPPPKPAMNVTDLAKEQLGNALP